MKFKFKYCHGSMAGKMYPHYDETVIEGNSIKEAVEKFNTSFPENFIEDIVVITDEEKLKQELLRTEKALEKMCKLMELQEKDSCYYCPISTDKCVDIKARTIGNCSAEKWKEWSLDEQNVVCSTAHYYF